VLVRSLVVKTVEQLLRVHRRPSAHRVDWKQLFECSLLPADGA